MPFRVLVIGPGALGCALGGVLERGGAEVAYLGRSAPAPAPVPDLALVTVKAYDTEAAIRGAARYLGPETPVLSLQNGLGNVEAIAGVVGAERTLGGSTTHAARRLPAGQVEHVAEGETRIAPLAAGALSVAREAAEALAAHGLAATAEADLRSLLWRKVAISCGVNAVTALEGCSNGQLLERPAALARAAAAAFEALEVARDLGLDADPAEAHALVRGVCARTAANRSSMLQDMERGRRTEADEINGAVARTAREKLGREAPVNAALAEEIERKIAVHA